MISRSPRNPLITVSEPGRNINRHRVNVRVQQAVGQVNLPTQQGEFMDSPTINQSLNKMPSPKINQSLSTMPSPKIDQSLNTMPSPRINFSPTEFTNSLRMSTTSPKTRELP